MKRPIVLIFTLFSTSFACMASANEVFFTCDYQLGAETGAKREKIGSVAVAIDVKNKTARIDFGKGWFKTNTLQINGTKVKEKAPSTSGKKLGFFYFDLRANNGGYSGDGFDEFFGACVQNSSAPNAANPRREAGSTTTNSDHQKQATDPATASEKTFPPRASGGAIIGSDGRTQSPTKPASAAEAAAPTPYETKATRSAAAPAVVPAAVNEPTLSQIGGKATTEYYGYTVSRAHPTWAAEATMNPAYEKKITRSAAAPAAVPAAVNEPAPPPTGGKAVTDYYGGTPSRANPAWAAEATMNTEYDKTKLPTVDASTGSPAVTPALETSIEACRGTLSAAARTSNLNFANSSSVLEPRSKADLQKIAKTINACGKVMVEVAGYTDDWGNSASNKTLSQLRANAVVDFLVAEGVASLKLKAVGYGQEQPIATNRTAEGRRLNRRVEFRITEPNG